MPGRGGRCRTGHGSSRDPGQTIMGVESGVAGGRGPFVRWGERPLSSRPEGATLMVVEDDPAIRQVLADLLAAAVRK